MIDCFQTSKTFNYSRKDDKEDTILRSLNRFDLHFKYYDIKKRCFLRHNGLKQDHECNTHIEIKPAALVLPGSLLDERKGHESSQRSVASQQQQTVWRSIVVYPRLCVGRQTSPRVHSVSNTTASAFDVTRAPSSPHMSARCGKWVDLAGQRG